MEILKFYFKIVLAITAIVITSICVVSFYENDIARRCYSAGGFPVFRNGNFEECKK